MWSLKGHSKLMYRDVAPLHLPNNSSDTLDGHLALLSQTLHYSAMLKSQETSTQKYIRRLISISTQRFGYVFFFFCLILSYILSVNLSLSFLQKLRRRRRVHGWGLQVFHSMLSFMKVGHLSSQHHQFMTKMHWVTVAIYALPNALMAKLLFLLEMWL